MKNMVTDQLSPSTVELFAVGNYTAVAMTGNLDQWQTFAAMGLVGKTRVAIDGLNRFDNPEARFYSAVASWIGGDEASAIDTLEKINTPHAQNLLALIRKPQIHVLAQLPWDRRGNWDLLTAALADGKFKIQNISFHPKDLPNEPYADIRKFYDTRNPPDFYICGLVELHVIPPNLQQLPCPIFGTTADYDLNIQTIYTWLQLFDEIVVADRSQWQVVSNLVRVPVSTFPKLFGVTYSLLPFTHQARNIDVFLSGTILHPYYPDKAMLVHQILRMPDITCLLINGFTNQNKYRELLSRSKVCFTYVRHPGAVPTRGLEALSMGCAVVVQKGCVLQLYAGEQEGVLTYELEANDLASNIRRILDGWPEFKQRARQGAETIHREFALQRVASQYLRFFTFLAAKPRGQRQNGPMEQLSQKRTILSKGLLPGGPDVVRKLRYSNLSRWRSQLDEHPCSRLYIDITRETILEHATKAHKNESILTDALRLYWDGIARFPQSLVLRFNLIRTALHFGQPQERSRAFELAEQTLAMPASSWQTDVMEDVFPGDFFNTFFNYRKYLDLVTEHLSNGTAVNDKLTKLILASLSYYLGYYQKNTAYFKQAVIHDPEFPFYKFSYAKQLIGRGQADDDLEATALLLQLAENSILFADAHDLLKQLEAQKRITGKLFLLKENTKVHKLRMGQRGIKTTSQEKLAWITCLTGFSKLERLKLNLSLQLESFLRMCWTWMARETRNWDKTRSFAQKLYSLFSK